jgi:uncharacterized Zn finger protein
MEKKTETMIPGLSEDKLLRVADGSIYHRAMDYYRRGAVIETIQLDYKLTASVDGSQYEPYQVHIKWDHAGIKKCYCDCPHNSEYCKHIIAVLLLCLHSPEKVQKMASLKESLQKLSKEQLCSLLENITGDDIILHRKVMMGIDSITDTSSVMTENKQSSPQRTWVDPQRYQKEAYRIFRSLHHIPSSQIYQHEDRVLKELSEIIDQAGVFIDKNDGNNALLILQALTEVYMKEWMTLDGSDSESGDFFYDLDAAWAEAILTANLSTSETTELRKRLESWQSEIEDYGIDDAFVTTQLALQQGWHDPELKRILQGEQEDLQQEREIYRDETKRKLTQIRLAILERQKRYPEYIQLAKHEGLPAQMVCMLMQQNQFADAIALARTELTMSEDALTVAMKLRNHFYIDDAISIAELGLNLRGYKLRIGEWLHDLAEATGNDTLARQALIVAFNDDISEERYERILKLTSDDEIQATKEQLLAKVREKENYSSVAAKANIFLKEELFDEAIDIVDKCHYEDDVVKHVMNAVIHYNPTWIIQQAHKRAMDIVDKNQAARYDKAVSWFTFVKKSYEAMGNMKEWQSHLDEIKHKHKPKYKLMGLLHSAFGEE